MADRILYEMVFEAEADVVRSEHPDECVAAHPGAPCPGFPHETKD